ncbi:MAG: hypothetical protein ACRCYV_02470, partial [Aeromonas sp.]
IAILRPLSPMSTEALLFYAACIRAQRWRYSYGRQANRTLKQLLLPDRSAMPAWVTGSIERVASQIANALSTG